MRRTVGLGGGALAQQDKGDQHRRQKDNFEPRPLDASGEGSRSRWINSRRRPGGVSRPAARSQREETIDT